jgi:nitrite reductase (NADH) large subunit
MRGIVAQMMMRYVIIGSGVAGTTAAATIRKRDPDGEITIITDEEYPFYSRIRLPEFLSGRTYVDGLIIHGKAWYEHNDIELVLGDPVDEIDPEGQIVVTSQGRRFDYDRLLLATGSVAYVPPIAGTEKSGVFTLRKLKDAFAIREQSGMGGRRIVIIGGGVLGLEVGYNLLRAGNEVEVVEYFERLLPRQTDKDCSRMLQERLEGMGFKFHLGATIKEITGEERVEGVLLEDGTLIESDLVIISAGVRAATHLAKGLDLDIERGILVDDRLETEVPNIYAAGDLIQHRGITYGIWPAAERQGEVAAINMSGGNESYEGTTVTNLLKVAEVDLMAAGNIDPEGEYDTVVIRDEETQVYKKLVMDDKCIIGTILFGDISDRAKILRAIDTKQDIRKSRQQIEQWDLETLA